MARVPQRPGIRKPIRRVVAKHLNAEARPRVPPSQNPFTPPEGDACPINGIPPELLSRIFQFGVTESAHDESGNLHALRLWDELKHLEMSANAGAAKVAEEQQDDRSKSPSYYRYHPTPSFRAVLSHVCRLWRDVAISTPSLWASITLLNDIRPPYTSVLPLLERSKEHPLDVRCEGVSVDTINALFLPQVHRWRSMSIKFWSDRDVYEFMGAVADSPVPQLTTLQLFHYPDTENFDDDDPKPTVYPILFGGSTPHLQRLTLLGVHINWDQPLVSSASNLTHLELASHLDDVRPSWAQFATILRAAPKLKQLTLSQAGPSGNPSEWVIASEGGIMTRELNSPIPLPNLTDLTVYNHSQAFFIALFRRLYMPSLKSLSLECREYDDTELVRELIGPATCIDTSPSQEPPRSLLSGLEHIKLSFMPRSQQSAEMLYAELQSLKSLTITTYTLSFDALLSPCTIPGQTVWLPLLETLTVSAIWYPFLSREVVQKRIDAGCPLKVVYLEEKCDIDEDTMEWFQSNLEEFGFFREESIY